MPRGTVTSVEGKLLIEQGGRRFVSPAPSVACVSSAWKQVANRGGLRPNDFTEIDGPACAAAQVCPDLGAQVRCRSRTRMYARSTAMSRAGRKLARSKPQA